LVLQQQLIELNPRIFTSIYGIKKHNQPFGKTGTYTIGIAGF